VATYRVEGLRSLIRATDAAGKETKKLVRDDLRRVAEPVKQSAQARFARYDARSASRYGISVRRTGYVSVEQRLRRTTGHHPQYGSLQMRKALIPALEDNTDNIVAGLEQALDRWARKWEARP
jgi:hypothetical protein